MNIYNPAAVAPTLEYSACSSCAFAADWRYFLYDNEFVKPASCRYSQFTAHGLLPQFWGQVDEAQCTAPHLRTYRVGTYMASSYWTDFQDRMLGWAAFRHVQKHGAHVDDAISPTEISRIEREFRVRTKEHLPASINSKKNSNFDVARIDGSLLPTEYPAKLKNTAGKSDNLSVTKARYAVYWTRRTTPTVVSASSREDAIRIARSKKKKGYGDLKSARELTASENRTASRGGWIRTRSDGKSPDKSPQRSRYRPRLAAMQKEV